MVGYEGTQKTGELGDEEGGDEEESHAHVTNQSFNKKHGAYTPGLHNQVGLIWLCLTPFTARCS